MTEAGKYVRENVWANSALMYAMKIFLETNIYKVLKEKENPESQKYSVAKHAADHLNELLAENPMVHCSEWYAAEFPISAHTMRMWMKTVFDYHWRTNKKGMANQTHEREDAVQQRMKYVFDNKQRQLQNMVWHHAHLESLKTQMPHIYDLARVSKRVDLETNLLNCFIIFMCI